MNRFVQSAALVPLIAWGAAAQEVWHQADGPAFQIEAKKRLEENIVKMDMVGAVKGPLVKGMPYSADEITETNQTLADGTKIHRETKVAVYRDNEGRTRRESADNVTINDPVAGTTYLINPKTNTVKKLVQSNTMIYRSATPGAPGEPATFSLRTGGDGQAQIEINGKQLDPKAVAELVAKAKIQGQAEAAHVEMLPPPEPGKMFVAAGQAYRFTTDGKTDAKTEQLGKKNMEGVIAEGRREVSTIATGAIGNDRPIEIVTESWYSDEIGQMVYSKRSDPRTGEEVFRMTNIRRGDPPAYLFQAPPDARSNTERKM